MLEIDTHSSVAPDALRAAAIAALLENRLDPKFLYVTPRQTELWREVFRRHSPIHRNPEFARIYREAFAAIAGEIASRGGKKVFLVGLGCGTGLKEAELQGALAVRGVASLFTAIDASRNLVIESVQRLADAGAEHRRSLVCDLAQAEHLSRWLGESGDDLPRVLTFFGLVPNLTPATVARLFRVLLRPGDVLLASAHLAPVAEDEHEELSLTAALHRVLPQYNNAETLAWLRAALEEAGLDRLVGAPGMTVDRVDGVPAFVAKAWWKSGAPLELWGERFAPNPTQPLRVFSSLRYTPALFEELLRREGFRAERLAITACREEAIWAIRRLS